MNIFSTITGLLIAAVLQVPGTTQREVTKVEDEPVVEKKVAERKKAATQLYVFQNTTSSGANSASNWVLTDPEDEPNCGLEGTVPCKILLDTEEYDDMADYLATHNFSSDADVVNGPGIISKR